MQNEIGPTGFGNKVSTIVAISCTIDLKVHSPTNIPQKVHLGADGLLIAYIQCAA